MKSVVQVCIEGPDQGYDGEVIAVYLDSGEEIGRYMVAYDAAHERELMETMLVKVIAEDRIKRGLAGLDGGMSDA